MSVVVEPTSIAMACDAVTWAAASLAIACQFAAAALDGCSRTVAGVTTVPSVQ